MALNAGTIEARPKKTKTSQYSGLQEWIRQDNYVTARIDCLVKDQPVRRLKYSQIYAFNHGAISVLAFA